MRTAAAPESRGGWPARLASCRGSATEGFIIVIPLAVLISYAMFVSGGPERFLALADRFLRECGTAVYAWAAHLRG